MVRRTAVPGSQSVCSSRWTQNAMPWQAGILHAVTAYRVDHVPATTSDCKQSVKGGPPATQSCQLTSLQEVLCGRSGQDMNRPLSVPALKCLREAFRGTSAELLFKMPTCSSMAAWVATSKVLQLRTSPAALYARLESRTMWRRSSCCRMASRCTKRTVPAGHGHPPVQQLSWGKPPTG